MLQRYAGKVYEDKGRHQAQIGVQLVDTVMICLQISIRLQNWLWIGIKLKKRYSYMKWNYWIGNYKRKISIQLVREDVPEDWSQKVTGRMFQGYSKVNMPCIRLQTGGITDQKCKLQIDVWGLQRNQVTDRWFKRLYLVTDCWYIRLQIGVQLLSVGHRLVQIGVWQFPA